MNGRFTFNAVTGVQRYAQEVSRRIAGHLAPVGPRRKMQGFKGHAWEQLVLPGLVGSRLLWSPCNTGPLLVRNQVVTIHDISPLDHPEWVSPKFAAWYAFLLPRLAKRCRRVLTDSNFSRDRMIDRFGLAPSQVISIPLAASGIFRPAVQDELAAFCASMQLVPGRYFLSVSSIEPRKNIAGLLKAWQAALAMLPDDVELVLTGKKGDERIFAATGIDSLPPRVRMTGYVDETGLPLLYGGAARFVYFSFYEGFGLPPLEAMACGTPVIVSDIPPLREVAGGAGQMVDPHDISAMAGALAAVFAQGSDDGLRRMSLARAAEFSWDRTAAMTLDALQWANARAKPGKA